MSAQMGVRALGAELVARLSLAKVCEPLDRVVAPLAAEVGVVEAWDRVRRNAGGKFGATAARVEALDLDRELYAASRLGLRVLVPGDDAWPPGFDDLEYPPWCVWVRGDADVAALARRSVAVVGARSSTPYGTAVARQLAAELSGKRFVVVSGAAFGIDAAAHYGALAAAAPTIAVLASGADRAYPVSHADLIGEIARVGAVLSECPPGAAPLKQRFLARNRLIAAMTSGTVVVEAGLRSGSLNTVSHAESMARPVGAVPGPVTSAMSAGTNQLIRDARAVLVTDAAEVAELVGPMGEELVEPKRGPDRPEDELRGAARVVYDTLPRVRGCSVDRLVLSAGLAVGDVLAALGELEVRDLAERTATGWRRR